MPLPSLTDLPDPTSRGMASAIQDQHATVWLARASDWQPSTAIPLTRSANRKSRRQRVPACPVGVGRHAVCADAVDVFLHDPLGMAISARQGHPGPGTGFPESVDVWPRGAGG